MTTAARNLFTLAALALLAAGAAIAQPPASPCDPEKSRQFDFWIGDWEVYAGETLAGSNTIEPILDGCVLQEHWVGTQGSAGSSLNFYDPRADRWRQYWVFRSGVPLVLEGGLVEGEMVLSGESTDQAGATVLNRVTWTPNPDGTVRQHWQQSRDGGKSWTDAFDGLYRRK